MKRIIVVVAVALVAVALYAVTATGSPQAVTPKQVAALSKKLAKLQKDFNTLKKLTLQCVFYKAESVGQFGNPQGNEGYVYRNPDTTEEVQTALDFAVPSTDSTWLLSTSASCANAINSGKQKTESFRRHVK